MTKIAITALYPDTSPYAYGYVTVRLVDAGSGGAVDGGTIVAAQTVKLDEDGEGLIDLTPSADTDPVGSFYAFTVKGSSPTVVRYLEVPAPNGSGDAEVPYAWDDPTIQRLVPDPPGSIPAAGSGTVGQVLGVVDNGDGKEFDLIDQSGAGTVAPFVTFHLPIVVDAVDGTGDEFFMLARKWDIEEGAPIPDGWDGSGPVDAATVASYLTGIGLTSEVRFLAYSGGEWAVYATSAATIDEPWTLVPASVASYLYGLLVVDLNDGALIVRDAASTRFEGSGLTTPLTTVQTALDAFEGHADGQRHVRGYFTSPVPDLSTLRAGAVADIDQPVTDDGQQVVKGDFVATLGDTDGDGNYWIHHVHPTTGQWGSDAGEVTPAGADMWDNAISTNKLTGGDYVVSKSGEVGIFLGARTNGSFTGSRGGPDPFGSAFAGGEWVFIGGGSGPDLSDGTPAALGTAAAGTSPDASRADHVHDMPTAANVGAVAGDGSIVTMVSITAAAYAALSPPVSTTFYVVTP